MKEKLQTYVETFQSGLRGFRHPLCVMVPFMDSDFEWDMIEKMITHKKESLEKTQSASTWIFLHERPFRLEALLNCPFDVDHELLMDVWIDCEGPWLNKDVWLSLFKRYETEYDHSLDEVDVKYLYRGGSDDGISWTTKRETAEWFAKRFNGEGVIYRIPYERNHAVAYTNGRDEHEVIVDYNEITDAETIITG